MSSHTQSQDNPQSSSTPPNCQDITSSQPVVEGQGLSQSTANANEPNAEDDAEIRDAVRPNDGEPNANSSNQKSPQPQSSSETAATFEGIGEAGNGAEDLPAGLRAGAGEGLKAPVEDDMEDAEAKISQKKDATLREFLSKMDDYAPIIPDAVTHHYMTLAGLPPPPQTPPKLARLLALATQKFVADIAADAYQYARIRSSHTTSNTANAMMGAGLGLPGQGVPGVPAGGPSTGAPGGGGGGGKESGAKGIALGVQRPGFGGGGQGSGQGRTVLTMEDLGMAVGEYGVNVKRSEFYR